MSASDYILGIDLGTTNSVVAILEGDQPRVLPNNEGSTKTPSVVSFLPNGDIAVGEIARRQGAVHPSRTISSVKRLMGRSRTDVESLGLRTPYDLTTSPENPLVIRIGDDGYTPAQISAFILMRLKQAAEDYLGDEVSKVIVTVPAYFDDLQRQATREAGRLAGLEVMRLVNEPTAAAMAYGLGKSENERVAVYDFGGGTFDLTILDIAGGTFEVLTSVGDTHLGGDDIDDLIAKHLLTEFRKQAGENYQPDAMAWRRMSEAAEKAKCELSIARQSHIHLPFLTQQDTKPMHLETVIRRETLEELIMPLVERTLDCCRDALEDCVTKVREIDKVILVGGSTRIPLVQDLVEDFFGIQPFKGINPDEIVAMGAAAQGGVMAGKLKEVILLDVTPHSLGVEVADGRMVRIIEKNSTIPLKSARLFTTTEDGQEMVMVHVLQGESERCVENRSLGKFTLTGLPAANAGSPRIQVTFQINADGMVEVQAEDLATRQAKSISVTVGGEQDSPLAGRDRRDATAVRRRRRRGTGRAGSGTDELLTGQNPSQSEARQRPAVPVSHSESSSAAFQPVSHVESSPNLQPVRFDKPPKSAQGSENAATISDSSKRKKPTESAPSPVPASAPAALPRTPEVAEIPTDPLEIPGAMKLSEASMDALRYIRQHGASASAFEAYLKAFAELSNYSERNLGDVEVVEGAVRILVMLGERDEARKLLTRMAESTNAPPGLVSELYEDYLAKFPQDEDIMSGKAMALADSGKVTDAVSRLEQICEGDATDAQIETLIQLYRKQLAENDEPGMQLKLVQLLIKRSRTDEAINLLQRLVQTETYRNKSLKILGLCFWQKGLHYLAWQKFQQLPPNEEIKDILYRLSADMEDTDQLLNAKVVLQHLADADPKHKDVAQRLRRVEQLIRLEVGDRDSNLTPSIFLTLKDSRFVILEEINRGSMGIVYRARDKVLEEIVALKILNDYMTGDPTAVERFKREARAAKRLSHPNIVRIHDMFEYGNKKLLSMEYIEGTDLKKLLLERQTLSADEIVGMVRQVCDALAYAHKLSIVHRDIKPANIMLTDDTLIKVTDFGIAKFLLAGPDATRSGSQIIGTPLYMSPEQIKGERVDPRADIYALGATMYEMASGRPPFLEGNIEYHHLHTPPAALPSTVPSELSDAILKCLAKSPDDRFEKTELLAEALASVATK